MPQLDRQGCSARARGVAGCRKYTGWWRGDGGGAALGERLPARATLSPQANLLLGQLLPPRRLRDPVGARLAKHLMLWGRGGAGRRARRRDSRQASALRCTPGANAQRLSGKRAVGKEQLGKRASSLGRSQEVPAHRSRAQQRQCKHVRPAHPPWQSPPRSGMLPCAPCRCRSPRACLRGGGAERAGGWQGSERAPGMVGARPGLRPRQHAAAAPCPCSSPASPACDPPLSSSNANICWPGLIFASTGAGGAAALPSGTPPHALAAAQRAWRGTAGRFRGTGRPQHSSLSGQQRFQQRWRQQHPSQQHPSSGPPLQPSRCPSLPPHTPESARYVPLALPPSLGARCWASGSAKVPLWGGCRDAQGGWGG